MKVPAVEEEEEGSFADMEGCCVCADDSGTEDNPLVYCDGAGCNVCVHKACYGIRSIPKGDWFCSRCCHLREQRITHLGSSLAPGSCDTANPSPHLLTPSSSLLRVVNCELCPSKEGAIKRTSDGKWAHVVCGLYIREAKFEDTEVMEPIVTSSIPKDRFQQLCYICVEEKAEGSAASTGASSPCEFKNCKKAFHVTCAQKKGLLCELTSKNNNKQVVYSGYCGDHIPTAESGFVDGYKFRKIPAYPRISGPSSERASSSSGYSTPNNPDKSPPLQPEQTQTLAAANNHSGSNESDNQQRSSSIKSVGSSGTTESADSGIQSSSNPDSRLPSIPSVAPLPATPQQQQQPPPGVDEQRTIRKPHKKSLNARMDGAGISNANPATTAMAATIPQSFGTLLAPPFLGLSNQMMDQSRYYVNNPFTAPHEMHGQFSDFSRQPPGGAAGNPGNPKGSQQEMGTPLPGKSALMTDRPTPPPLRKRALSPSILDSNETLTISSLIERTIERATTSTTTMPLVSVPFTTGVKPPYANSGDEKQQAPLPTAAHEGPAAKKPKKSAKESKNDLRRAGGNTATIKDLLASSNMSPQQNSPASLSEPPSKAPTPKSRMPPGSTTAVSGFASEADRTSQSDSPFSRDRPASPKSVSARQQEDRHRNAVEKVQHYLNTSMAVSDAPVERPASAVPATSAKSKRKPQKERAQPLFTGKGGQPAVSSEEPAAPAPPQPQQKQSRDDQSSRKTNGFVNGSGSAAPSEDDCDSPAGAQAFDTLMMALSTFGTTAAQQSATNSHPTAATTLDGFFRMQKELNMLKQKVGELEGLKAFYLTQVQSLRTLADKHAADGSFPIVQPTMPEEVARLLSLLGGEPAEEQPPAPTRSRHGPTAASENAASDGLLARLHEPGAPSRDPTHRSPRDSRPESRVQTSGSSSSAPVYNQQPQQQHLQAPSPSLTRSPKPPSRSRIPREVERDRERERERDRDREYANSNGYARRSHYPNLEQMDGIPSGVISTPAPVVSQPQLIMPNVAGTQFLLQNGPQLYPMPMDQRMLSMFPGQLSQAFFPGGGMYPAGMGFISAPSPSDYAGIGRMHTPTSSRYPGDESSGVHQQHGNVKREYEMSREN